jgi:ornithine carbamoyltransferase
MSGPHFLDITDLRAAEIGEVLDLAMIEPSALGAPLAGHGAALLFEKPSNRTRQSMEMAVFQLGGHPITTRGEEVGLDVRESVEDIAMILGGYHRLLAARVFDHSVLTRMVAAIAASPVPSEIGVINMLSDRSHPLQGLADALQMRRVFGGLGDLKVAWVGDYNNVARSLGEICALHGAELRYACPVGFGPGAAEVQRLGALGPVQVLETEDPFEAVDGAHAVHTDTWVSMGQEDEKAQRLRTFERYQVTAEVMSAADPSAIFMHCLPAYRGLEVAAEVIDGPQSRVIAQGHDRLHAARGLIAFMLGVRIADLPDQPVSDYRGERP